MVRGLVKWFNQEKGFGFIEVTSGPSAGTDVFVHATDIEGRPLREEDQVELDVIEDDRKGKKRAGRVTGGTGREGDKGDKGGRDRDGGGKGYGKDRDGGKGKGGKPGDWDCADCSAMNFASRDRCFKCAANKPSGGGGKGRGRADSRGPPPARDSRSRSRGRGGR